MTDAFDSILDAARSGNRAAAASILAKNLPLLERWLDKRVGLGIRARESISDLAQSVCREVLQDLDDFELRTEEEFRAWLLQQAGRKVVDRYRFYKMAKRDLEREERLATHTDGAGASPTPSRHASMREELDQLRSALEQLPEPQREAIVLHRLVGLNYEEIGDRQGKSAAAVRGLVARGLAALSLKL